MSQESEKPLTLVDLSRVASPPLAGFLLERSSHDQTLKNGLVSLIKRHTSQHAATPDQLPQPRTDSTQYIVGNSPAMLDVFEKIRRYALSSAPVLVAGESGTGKELVARAIHQRSSWGSGPFVAINCGALPEALIGSELFGHERGAFTGAVARKIGRVEAAEGGTIFLDEIGDLPLETQGHLLRFLQEKTFERIGGCKSIAVNARIIAATNVNLSDAVAQRRFREDLYFRLNVLPVELPPLRRRGTDLQILTKYFLKVCAGEMGRAPPSLSAEAERVMSVYRWPGNVRELLASIRRAVVMTDNDVIQSEALGLSLIQPGAATPANDLSSRMLFNFRDAIAAELVKRVLERNNYNVTRTAEELNVSRVTVYRLISKYEIQLDRGLDGR